MIKMFGHSDFELILRVYYAQNDDARLVAEGNVPTRKYVQAGSKLEGTVPIRLTLPKDAVRFTIVIEDESGKIIRSMGGLESVVKWRKSGHIHGDLVHFKPPFHELMMKRLGRALMARFRAYLRRKGIRCSARKPRSLPGR